MNILTIFITCLLLFSISTFQLPLLRYIAIALMLFISLYKIIKDGIVRREFSMIIPMLMCFIIPVFNINTQITSPVTPILFTALSFFILNLSLKNTTAQIILFILSFFVILDSSLRFLGIGEFLSNPNATGAAAGALILLCIDQIEAKKIRYYIFTPLILSLTFSLAVSSTRSAILSVILSYIASRIIKSRQSILSMGLIAITILVYHFAVIYYYVYFSQSYIAGQINTLARILFAKNFFSGREDRWLDAINVLKNDYIFGAGSNNAIFTDSSLSLHNLILQLAADFGIFGILAVFLFLLLSLISIGNATENHAISRSYLTETSSGDSLKGSNRTFQIHRGPLSILLYGILIQSFEVFYFSNNISIGVILLVILISSRDSRRSS